MEDVLRAMVIVGLATWAAWGFMVGLRANEGQVLEVKGRPAAAPNDDDDGDPGSPRLRA